MRAKKTEAETVEAGSGDVLVDLGFPDAYERKVRVQLAMRLNTGGLIFAVSAMIESYAFCAASVSGILP